MFPVYKFGVSPKWNAKYEREGAPQTRETAYESQPFVQAVLRSLSPGSSVLDAGCGTGGLVWFLHTRGFRTAGIDASETAISVAKRVVPVADLRIASIEELPFPDGTFDAYVAIGSWEYLEGGPSRAAGEALRVLKPGGFLFVEVPHANPLRLLAYLPLKRIEYVIRRARGHTPRFDHYMFSVGELRQILETNGFRVLKIQPHDLPEPSRHYGLWVDWPFLRGGADYELNLLGRCVKAVSNAISPWTISTGMFIVARKQ